MYLYVFYCVSSLPRSLILNPDVRMWRNKFNKNQCLLDSDWGGGGSKGEFSGGGSKQSVEGEFVIMGTIWNESSGGGTLTSVEKDRGHR